jgi:phosphotransferase system  glucose/maltose/N-acetylglucosamine-specific IIC component
MNFRNLVTGFVAAAIAVLTVHQSIVFGLDSAGVISREAWSVKPHGPLQIPTILNSVFWGGLWGSVLALLYNKLPGSAAWIKGLLFGWLIYFFSNNLILPLIKGNPLFFGGDLNQLAAVFLILSGFGMATAIIYNAFRVRDELA